MRLHRFFIPAEAVQSGRIRLSDEALIKQIKNVLRLRPGDSAVFLDGSGKEYTAKLADMDRDMLTADIEATAENRHEAELRITLVQAMCKKDKFEWVLQKGTEAGIARFVPVLAARSEKLGLNRERAEKILREAAEQSERGIVPELAEAQDFAEALASPGEKILLDESGDPVKTFHLPPSALNLNVFVGPEGGWTEAELDSAKQAGAKIVSVGPRVLRTETAGLVIAAILLNR
ncbi:MAG: 16S rRNA (uracil(1498)-N(3))-methyltransferase [Patescibacteria group bacterium]|nr:16S rRNA (uracil(1498)-N(3))-methyltransferase [Patescibacteria group bacterium]